VTPEEFAEQREIIQKSSILFIQQQRDLHKKYEQLIGIYKATDLGLIDYTQTHTKRDVRVLRDLISQFEQLERDNHEIEKAIISATVHVISSTLDTLHVPATIAAKSAWIVYSHANSLVAEMMENNKMKKEQQTEIQYHG